MGDVLAHVLFIGDYDTTRFNGAFWSLVHEMRISLAFPLLDWLILGLPLVRAVGIAVVMIVAGSFLSVWIGSPNNPGETLHYAGLFAAGILVAQRRVSLAKWVGGLTGPRAICFSAAAIFAFYYGRGVARLVGSQFSDLLDVPVGLGAVLIVIWALQSKWLLTRPMQWLGERSFSLYLVHVTVLLGLIDCLHLQHPNILLVFLFVPLTLAVTELFYLIVERPLLQLSRRLN
jgi:peptidoglycan/LPS O-acetylase OafA/YrhL